MATHLMLDIETLSTQPGGVIFQIASITFCPHSGRTNKTFCMDIDIDDAVAESLTICPHTEEWWRKQGGIRQKCPFPLHYVLTQFIRWIQEEAQPDYIWVWGVDFDLPMLKHALDLFDITPPWKYWQQRDARTIWTLAHPGARHTSAAHDALTDCITQAKELSRALHTLDISPLALT